MYTESIVRNACRQRKSQRHLHSYLFTLNINNLLLAAHRMETLPCLWCSSALVAPILPKCSMVGSNSSNTIKVFIFPGERMFAFMHPRWCCNATATTTTTVETDDDGVESISWVFRLTYKTEAAVWWRSLARGRYSFTHSLVRRWKRCTLATNNNLI